MKKLILLLVFAAFVFLLSGCGPTYYETPRYEGRYYRNNYHRNYHSYDYYPSYRHRHYRGRPGVNVQIGVHN